MPSGVKRSCQVVVIGAGPTGLMMANMLGRYGVRTLLVERNPSTVQAPRAVSIDDESLRTVQAIGAIDDILAEVVPGYGSEYLTRSRKPFLRVEPTERPYGFPRRNAFRQPVFEQQLRDHLLFFPSVESLFGWSAEILSNDREKVRLSLASAEGATREIEADFVVAAEGANSAVRIGLGIEFDGETFAERWLIVDLENSPTPSRETIVFCDRRRPCIALPGPNATRRFEFKLVDGDEADSIVGEKAVRDLLHAHEAAPDSRIVRSVVYTFHARVASSWQNGRVFLAGDACHLTPPFAGQGMNSGIRDAHNLAWKLAWVLRGILPACILPTYESERRPHVGAMIALALRMGRIMGPSTILSEAVVQTGFRLLGLVPAVRDYFGQMKYKPKPRFANGLILPDGRPQRRTSVGRLIPQPMIETENGPVLLDEELGEGFALIGFDVSAGDLDQARRLPAIAGLDPRCLAIFSARAQPSSLAGIRKYRDSDGRIARGFDAPAGRIFLVRPDRYLLGAFVPEYMEAFDADLRQLLTGEAGDYRIPIPTQGAF